MTSQEKEVAQLEEFERNCRWLDKHYDSLRPLYAGRYVAVLKQQVVDQDEDIKVLMDRLEKNYPDDEDVADIEYVSFEDFEMILCI